MVRPQHEQAATRALEAKGLEAWAPTRKTRRRWSDRLKDVDAPLFPGYVFCRFARADRRRALETPGVIRVVGFNGVPAAIDATELDAIRRAVEAGLSPRPCERWRVGQRVRIDQGPLAGSAGVLERTSGETRLILQVTLLQRAVAVEIEERWATALGGSR